MEHPMTSGQARKGDATVLCMHIVAGTTLRAAATAAGMSERTARRRLREPDVVDMLERMADERSAAITAELVGLGRTAIGVLREAMTETYHGQHVRVRAANAALSLTLRYQSQSIERRLVALEEARLEHQRAAAELRAFLGGE